MFLEPLVFVIEQGPSTYNCYVKPFTVGNTARQLGEDVQVSLVSGERLCGPDVCRELAVSYRGSARLQWK